jgi:virginiamycin B lyase
VTRKVAGLLHRTRAPALCVLILLTAGACSQRRSASDVIPDLPTALPSVLPSLVPQSPSPTATVTPAPTATPVRTLDPNCTLAVKEYPTTNPQSRPTSITSGPDGALWFADGRAIGRMTTDGVVRSFGLPTGVRAFGIASGPDGNLWFTDQGTTAVGRLTVSGSVRMFPTPTREGNPIGVGGAANPLAITPGPDGALWFTESAADTIGRITVDGKITEYVLPSYKKTHANPQGIVAGPDGRIWFAQPLTESIGRFDPKTRKFAEFPIPVEDSMPGDVTSAHGAIWFNEPDTHSIGRMSTSGAVKLFPVRQADSTPWQVGRGSDGDVWYLESRHNVIGTVTEDGRVRDFPLPSKGGASADAAIVAGPDGAIWFTETGAGKIGRIGCG